MGMTEPALSEHVRVIARDLGLLHYHTHRSTYSQPGFPDWVFVNERGGIMYRELKSEKGTVTTAQARWLNALAATGADTDVWRPADLLSHRIHVELVNLSRQQ